MITSPIKSMNISSKTKLKHPSQINIEDIYTNLLNQWLMCEFKQQKIGRYIRVSPNSNAYLMEQFFENRFMPQLKRMTQLQIIYDKYIYEIIVKILQNQPSFIRITKQAGKNKTKYEKLVQIADVLAQNKFITNVMLLKIKKIASPQNSIQSKLYKILQQVNKCKNINSSKLQQIWEQYFTQSIQYVWINLLVKNEQKLGNYILGNMFRLYRGFLPYKQKPYLFYKIRLMCEFNKMQKSELITHLIMKQQYMNQQEYEQIFQQELNKLYSYIRQAISQQNDKISINFQLFGSCRSGFRLQNSDIDITIFCKQETRQVYNTINILKTIDVYFQKLQNYCYSTQYIPGAKVPVLKLQLNNNIIRSVDIVLNNMHGVENSRFLKTYSQIPNVKLFGLLIKKWCKSYDLVGIKKFSSYSVMYMMLFYLIKVGKLNPVQRTFITKNIQAGRRGNRIRQQQRYKPKIIAQNKLHSQIDLFQDFKNFLKFYSRQGYFNGRKQTICLLQQCKAQSPSTEPLYPTTPQQLFSCNRVHEKINKYFFLYNMHDPFDDSNPGRFKKQDQNQLYSAIDNTLKILDTGDNGFILQLFHPNNKLP